MTRQPTVPARIKIQRQQERIVGQRAWWTELTNLAAKGDVQGFWRRYAQYLEYSVVISDQRRLLRDMALRTAETICQVENEDVG